MAGWDYLLLEAKGSDEAAKLARLAKLGEQSWELVAVDNGTMFFKRYANYQQLKPDVGAQSNAQTGILAMPADEAGGQKKISAISSSDAGVDDAMHTHRVTVLVDSEMNVVRGETDEVQGHTHPITLVGSLDESQGHTHTFSVYTGGDRTTQYDG
jgi:hypothetical protein